MAEVHYDRHTLMTPFGKLFLTLEQKRCVLRSRFDWHDDPNAADDFLTFDGLRVVVNYAYFHHNGRGWVIADVSMKLRDVEGLPIVPVNMQSKFFKEMSVLLQPWLDSHPLEVERANYNDCQWFVENKRKEIRTAEAAVIQAREELQDELRKLDAQKTKMVELSEKLDAEEKAQRRKL